MPPDIRWQQRFASFCQALDQLETFFQPPALKDRERQGLIKAFDYCFALGWNTLRDLLLAEGNADLIGSRDTLRLAFRVGLIGDGESWLRMVQDRNLTNHPYNHATAEQVSQRIAATDLTCFRELRPTRRQRQSSPGSDIDLTLVAPDHQHADRLRLMVALDDLLLPWGIDLSLHHELPPSLRDHVARVGRRLAA